MTYTRSNPNLPHGWHTTELGEVAELRRGLSWAKSQERAIPTNGCVPVLRIPNVQDRLELDDMLYLDGVTANDIEECGATAGWSLMVASNGNPDRVGNCVLIDRDTEFVFASFLVAVGTKDRTRLSPEFLYRLLRSHTVRRAVTRNVQGSTGLNNINLNLLLRQPVPVPPPAEQAKIAAVLGAVDEAVERSRGVIAQTKTLRQALLHTLLTRGLPGRHTKFKTDRWLGTYPTEWKAVRLGEVTEVQQGIALGPHRLAAANPMRYLRVANVQMGNLDLSEIKEMEVAPREREKYSLRLDDVLIVEGHANVAELGRAAMVTNSAVGMSFQNHLFRVRAKPKAVHPRLLVEWVNGRQGRMYFAVAGGTTSGLNTVGSGFVKSMKMALPDWGDQCTIAKALDVEDARVAAAEAHLAQLERVKSALSAALLTGAIRVPVGGGAATAPHGKKGVRA